MDIKPDYNLSKLNTFGIDARAKYFTEIRSEAELKELFNLPKFKENQKMFLGGGSNILFTKDFDGIVVLNGLKGIEIVDENETKASVRSLGGELWHDLVIFAVEHGFWGIENLSLIPGTVGAAPMQNIGAYGAELKNVLQNVEAFEIETSQKKIFSKEECRLGYRDSVFKNELKGKYFIFALTLNLSKKPARNATHSVAGGGKKKKIYPALEEYLRKNNIEVKTPRDISEAVASIRRSKLPDPKLIGNAGSFFKNIFVPEEKFKELSATYPNMPAFEEDGVKKIPAGWLIEQCGWKGKRVGRVGVHEKQALVLVNYGGATGAEVLELAHQIIQSVKEKFDLELIPEVNLI